MGISFRKPAAVAAPASKAVAQGNKKMEQRLQRDRTLSTSASATMGGVALDIDMEPLLEGMDYSTDDRRLFDLYRDIYYYDPIGGSYVDMYSNLAYGDLSFGGGKDSFLEPFYDVCNRLKLVSTIPQIQTDRMVTGAHVSSMLYDRKKSKFFDLMSHRFDDIEVTPLPLANQDPILEWNVPDTVRDALQHSSPRIKQLRQFLGDDLMKKMEGGSKVELEPLGTIWLPRCPFTTGEPISCYRRLLPIWLMEKNLYRGTLIESGKRQRPILHAQLGDGGEWEPTTEEMEAIMDLIQSADADPLGAVIATRLGVQINEFRCLGSRTLIHSAQGIVPISEMVDHDPMELAPDTCIELGVQVQSMGGLRVATHWHYRGYGDIWETTTNSGTKIQTTVDHKFPTLDAECNVVCRPINEIARDHAFIMLEGGPDDVLPLAVFADAATLGWGTDFIRQLPIVGFSYRKFHEGAYDKLLARVEQISPVLYKNMVFLLTMGYKFEHVADFKHVGKDHLYDLSMERTPDTQPLFVANGILVRNSGGEFWKVTDIWDTTTQYKLRALGASEALLSGDATFSNGDTGLMAFMESLAAGRNELTRCLFYEKVFPLVAIIHGLAVTRNGSIVRKTGMMDGSMMDVMNRMNDGSRLFIPTVHWNKRLRPESDQGQMEALRTMTDMGVPIPIRAIAAAAGYNLDQLLGDQDENLAYQRKLLDYKRRVGELNKQMGGEEAGGGGGSFSSVLPQGRTLNWRNRDWSSVGDQFTTGSDGKKHHVMSASTSRHNARANENIYRAIQKINDAGNHPLRGGDPVSRSPRAWEKGKAP